MNIFDKNPHFERTLDRYVEACIYRHINGSTPESNKHVDEWRESLSAASVEGISDTALTFTRLRRANMLRLPQFKNKHGQLAHSRADGSDWSPAQWLQAVTGELGEYANVRKKFERGDLTVGEFTTEARKELADVLIYMDILAFQLGIDLDEAIRAKFNEVSRRVGCDVKL